MRKILIVLFMLITVHFVCPNENVRAGAEGATGSSASVTGDQATGNLFVENVMSLGADKHYTIVVEKIPNKLHLLRIEGDSQEAVDSFPVLTGKNEGNKRARGDERTPEGVYYIESYMDQMSMYRRWGEHALRYGMAAYPINYPNPIDKIKRKTGSGIWIHGLDPKRYKPVTEGCVGLRNADLKRIMPYIRIGMPVIIIDNASFVSEAEYLISREEQIGRLKSFINAWDNSDFDVFKGHVHPQYSSYAGENARVYLERKKHLMARYPERFIEIVNINIYKQNHDTLVYDFDQFYCASNTISFGNKRIYLENDGDSFKVISEEFRSKSPQRYLEPNILAFLAEWKEAWESRDIDRYMTYYGGGFPGLKNWRDAKEGFFAKTETIRVDIKDVRWQMLGKSRIQVTFLQDYFSDTLTDQGIKRLTISGCPGAYKIESEDWSRR